MKEIEIFCPTFSPEAFKVAAKHLRADVSTQIPDTLFLENWFCLNEMNGE